MDLQDSIEKFAKEEKDRREKAIEFLNDLANKLQPIAPDLWGGEYSSVILTADGVVPHIRYQWSNDDYSEGDVPRFFSVGYGFADDIRDVHGDDFWSAVFEIAKWARSLEEKIQDVSRKRDDLLSEITHMKS